MKGAALTTPSPSPQQCLVALRLDPPVSPGDSFVLLRGVGSHEGVCKGDEESLALLCRKGDTIVFWERIVVYSRFGRQVVLSSRRYFFSIHDAELRADATLDRRRNLAVPSRRLSSYCIMCSVHHYTTPHICPESWSSAYPEDPSRPMEDNGIDPPLARYSDTAVKDTSRYHNFRWRSWCYLVPSIPVYFSAFLGKEAHGKEDNASPRGL